MSESRNASREQFCPSNQAADLSLEAASQILQTRAQPLDSNEKSFHRSSSFSNVTGSLASSVNSPMVRSQKLHAKTFDCITRTSQSPGNCLHTSCATRVPTPHLRYPRTTKNSVISHTVSLPETLDPLVTKANPANLPSL